VTVRGCAIPPGSDGHREGRKLLAAMYREVTGEEMPPIATEKWGKPYFTEGTWHFSVSHTKRHVFCALAQQPVGIDAEEIDRDIDLRLARKILSPGELTRWENARDPRLALLKLWVLKEAAAKCAGTGLRGYPNKTDFSPEDPRVTEMLGCLVAVLP